MIETRNVSDEALTQHVWGIAYVDEIVQIAVNQDPSNATSGTATENVCERFFWVCQDANYNVLGVVGPQGDLVERYEYTPYGRRRVFTRGWLLWDINGNGTVDDDDEDIIDAEFGANPASRADLNGNGVVEAGDWTAWADNYGKSIGDDDLVTSESPHSFLSPTPGTSKGTSLCDIGHQGLMHDKEFGLIYNRARYLHPILGRFTGRDPKEYVDGMNLYEYVRSNPVDRRDPSGEVPIFWGHPELDFPTWDFSAKADSTEVTKEMKEALWKYQDFRNIEKHLFDIIRGIAERIKRKGGDPDCDCRLWRFRLIASTVITKRMTLMEDLKNKGFDVVKMAKDLRFITSNAKKILKTANQTLKTVEDYIDYVRAMNAVLPGSMDKRMLNATKALKPYKHLRLAAVQKIDKVLAVLKPTNDYLGDVVDAAKIVTGYNAARSDHDMIGVAGEIMEQAASYMPKGVSEMIEFYGKFLKVTSRHIEYLSKGWGEGNRYEIETHLEKKNDDTWLPLRKGSWFGHVWARKYLQYHGGVASKAHVAREKEVCKGQPD